MKTLNNFLMYVAIMACPATGTLALAQSWTRTGAPTNAWTAVATSADGTQLVAVGGHSIYTSTNYGLTWTSNNAPNLNWTSVASSADGTRLVAAGGAVYTNSGTIWTLAFAAPKDGPSYEQNITSVASSADGVTLIAGSSFGDPLYSPKPLLYVSTDSGANWINPTNSPPGQPWVSVVSSADGNYLAAARAGSTSQAIYTSTNAGALWSSNILSASPFLWSSLACSADGRVLLAAAPPILFASTNAGATWVVGNNVNVPITRIACATNGTVWFGVSTNTGRIYHTLNAGLSWTTNTAPATNWVAIAVSRDGNRAVAAVSGGGLYVLQPPALSITAAGNSVSVFWTTNETGFGLEQNTNLAAANWETVTNLPVATNLFYWVSLPAMNFQQYFRLAAP